MLCTSYGERNPVRARFCLICGSALRDEYRPQQERKVVTVVFCDLVGFTAVSERLGTDGVQRLPTIYQGTQRAFRTRHSRPSE
jgi:class 3 adenylate cyclase